MENWKKGKELFDNQDFKKALDYLSKHLSKEPYHTEAIYCRAITYRRLEQFDKSFEDFEILINLVPSDATLISERGIAKFYLNDKKGALDDMDKSVEMEPENPYRYSSRAYIRAAANDVEGAIEDYQKAIALDPEDAIAMNNLGLLEERRGKVETAKKHYQHSDKLLGVKTGEEREISFRNKDFTDAAQSITDKRQIEKNQENGEKSFFASVKETVIKLFTDKNERKDFWEFVKRGGNGLEKRS